MVQKRSALCENSKNQILANDLVRRPGNTDEIQGEQILGEAMERETSCSEQGRRVDLIESGREL